MRIGVVVPLILVLVAAGVWFLLRHRSHPPREYGGREVRDDAGRRLRMMMLATPPGEFAVVPSQEFPRIYGVLMDWPVGDGEVATVFSTSDGAASIYTTSSFGIIGGEAHEAVRAAARTLVRAADRFHDTAVPTTDYPYPASDRVRFYFLSFQGVRVIETDLASLVDGTNEFADLARLGHGVWTELRLIHEASE